MNTKHKQLEVFRAVRKNSSVFLDELLKYKDMQSLDYFGENGYSPLSYAVFKCRYQMTEQLLCAGADVNFVDNNGRTPLMEAARDGYLGICRLLIHHGANINAKGTSYHRTALENAVGLDRYEIASFLLDNGAKPYNPSRTFVYSPLALASYCESDNILKLLLNHCSKTNQILPLAHMFNRSLKHFSDNHAILVLKYGYYPLVKSDISPYSSLLYKAACCGFVQTMSFMVEINPHFLQEEWLIKGPFPGPLRLHAAYKSWLVEYRKQVPCLQKLCKSKILSQVESNYKFKVLELPLPKLLHKYLCVVNSTYYHKW